MRIEYVKRESDNFTPKGGYYIIYYNGQSIGTLMLTTGVLDGKISIIDGRRVQGDSKAVLGWMACLETTSKFFSYQKEAKAFIEDYVKFEMEGGRNEILFL